jgi:hypothetical protein
MERCEVLDSIAFGNTAILGKLSNYGKAATDCGQSRAVLIAGKSPKMFNTSSFHNIAATGSVSR